MQIFDIKRVYALISFRNLNVSQCLCAGISKNIDPDVSGHGPRCGVHGDVYGTAVSSPHVHRMCPHGKGDRRSGSYLFQGNHFFIVPIPIPFNLS